VIIRKTTVDDMKTLPGSDWEEGLLINGCVRLRINRSFRSLVSSKTDQKFVSNPKEIIVRNDVIGHRVS
jgi:hypothetical protein